MKKRFSFKEKTSHSRLGSTEAGPDGGTLHAHSVFGASRFLRVPAAKRRLARFIVTSPSRRFHMKLALYAIPALLLAATPCLAQATTADDANSPRGGVMDTNPNPTPQNSATNIQGSTSGLSNSSGALNNGTTSTSTASNSTMSDTTASNSTAANTSSDTASNSAPSNQMAMNDRSTRSKSHMSEKQLNAEEAQETKQLNQDESQYAGNPQQ
jgi:hypothetical protein